MTDDEIIGLFWKRSEEAISEAKMKYGGYCAAVSRNILQDERDVEECMQDTFFNAWNSIPPQRPSILKAFLARIARNISINLYKKKYAQKRNSSLEIPIDELSDCIPDHKNDVEHITDGRLITNCINMFLKKQTKVNSDIFVCRYWFIYSIREISNVFGISESKVNSILYRMRISLKDELEKAGVVL